MAELGWAMRSINREFPGVQFEKHRMSPASREHVIKQASHVFLGRTRTHDLLLAIADTLANSTFENAGGEWLIHDPVHSEYRNKSILEEWACVGV